MCTVTYIPPLKGNGFILTSNRDERVMRQTTPPARYGENGSSLWFPQDRQSGGSWIAVSEKGRISCLLNGAFEPHQKQEKHTLSRGRILMELAAEPGDVQAYFLTRDLGNVEPFTIVSIDHQQGSVSGMSQCTWDGSGKHYRKLDPRSPYIWSSVTLYDEDHRNLRREWFHKFFAAHREEVLPREILKFHRATHISDPSVNVIMQREGGLRTVSITQVTPGPEKISMNYFDLIEESEHAIEI